MKLELMVLADYAAVLDGKLVITGVFDRFNSPSMPFTAPLYFVALKLRHEPEDKAPGEWQLRIALNNPSDKEVFRADVSLKRAKSIDLSDELVHLASIQVAVPMPPIPIKEYGDYSVVASLEGKQIGQQPLFVVDPTQLPARV